MPGYLVRVLDDTSEAGYDVKNFHPAPLSDPLQLPGMEEAAFEEDRSLKGVT
jgi:hypothetical protein